MKIQLFKRIVQLSLGFSLFLLICVYGQVSPVKRFGEVTLDEMRIAKCPYDSSATAIILFDYDFAVMRVDRGKPTYH